MSQVLKNLQLVTQSYSGTPSTGTGALFASGSTLYFENAAGTAFPLGATSGGPGYLIVREYTGSNPGGGTLTPTWNNNSSIKYIQVICVGAGGGGGSGAIGGGTRFSGGAGGGGGAIAWGFFDSASLTQASYPISIGAGGAGGGITTFNGSGTPNSGQFGSAGGYTTFGGNIVSASGGSGGGRGANQTISAGGAGGLATLCLPGPGFAIPGGTGGSSIFNNANSTPPINFLSSPLTPTSTAGGGAGSHVYNLSGLVYFSGSLGAGGFEWNTLKLNNTTYLNSGSNNLVTGTVLLQFTSSIITTTYGLGGGGNGGDNASIQLPGGNGGLYGAGGGGSNARIAPTGQSNQVGGSGSSGLCIVIEYY
jgi:hypothetical protein